MTKPTPPELRKLAQRILAIEAAGTQPADAESPAMFRVCEKLRRSLSRLTGLDGFRSLLSRALALAGEEVGWFKAVRVMSDGSLVGLDEVEKQISPREIAKGEIILITKLMGLLVTFIGEGLTFRLLQQTWPEVSFDNLDSERRKSDG
ncbi:MAG TPA: hypothetical protein VJ875_00095 [Pyrinomonadaceae bacterium]|nr:hypothetical protein [Pyrinomonadaceae bacterium]